jgi:hypothetical protein
MNKEKLKQQRKARQSGNQSTPSSSSWERLFNSAWMIAMTWVWLAITLILFVRATTLIPFIWLNQWVALPIVFIGIGAIALLFHQMTESYLPLRTRKRLFWIGCVVFVLSATGSCMVPLT